MMPRSPRIAACRLVLAGCLLAGTSGTAVVAMRPSDPETFLDRVFAAYEAGDPGIVTRTVTGLREYEKRHLNDRRAMDRWLGVWQPRKATFLIELLGVTTVVAPTQTGPLALVGQRYVADRPTHGTSAADDAFERLWHRTAIGMLQGLGLASFEEQYLETLRARRRGPANAPFDDDRLQLAYAIAAEQRCWNERPDLFRAGEKAAAVTRASGSSVTSDLSNSEIVDTRARQRACLTEAAVRFDAASLTAGAAAEARVRGAWMRFQLGQFPEAHRTIDTVDAGTDRELAYWAALFHGRIDDALGRQGEAERAYREALAAWPDAQSAGVGLVLTLFRLDRPADADAMALAIRSRPNGVRDPWWTYPDADRRFVDDWIARLRAPRP